MAIFKIVPKKVEYDLKTIGNHPQTKRLIEALVAVDEENGKELTKGGWEKVKSVLEKYSFKIMYDRNLAIIITALFVAISRSKNQDMISWAKQVVNHKVFGKIGKMKKALGQALLDGDGEAIYNIFGKVEFQHIMFDGIGVKNTVYTDFRNRAKRITPWKISASKRVLEVIKDAFDKMTGEFDDTDYSGLSELFREEQPQPEPKPEAKPAQPEPQPEPQPGPQPEPQPKPKPEPQPEPQPAQSESDEGNYMKSFIGAAWRDGSNRAPKDQSEFYKKILGPLGPDTNPGTINEKSVQLYDQKKDKDKKSFVQMFVAGFCKMYKYSNTEYKEEEWRDFPESKLKEAIKRYYAKESKKK